MQVSIFPSIYVYLKVLPEKYGVFVAALSSFARRREGENGTHPTYIRFLAQYSPEGTRACNQRVDETAYCCFEGTEFT